MLTPVSDVSLLLRRAREEAGLSTRELARSASVAASTVSRIESGRVVPTVGMLDRLLSACGRTLRLEAPEVCGGLTLASLHDAWRVGPDGGLRPDFTRLRAFTDHLLLHPDESSAAIQPAPPRSGPAVMLNLLAALAETVADRVDTPPPAWTGWVEPLEWEWHMPATPLMLEERRRMTPPRFRGRGLILSGDSIWRDPATVGLGVVDVVGP